MRFYNLGRRHFHIPAVYLTDNGGCQLQESVRDEFIHTGLPSLGIGEHTKCPSPATGRAGSVGGKAERFDCAAKQRGGEHWELCASSGRGVCETAQ